MMLCSLVPVTLVLVLLNSIKAHTQRFNSAGEELRLIKTSESDNGTWYTEQEKLDLFISNPARAQFVDITEPQKPRGHRITLVNGSRIDKRQVGSFPEVGMYNWIATPLTWDISFKNPKMWVKMLTEFPNRYYNGPWGASSSSTVMDLVTFAASPNLNITVKLFPHTYDQPSVIATIPGKSADVVIVSTHFDSINSVNPKLGLAPGAIDNASGVVTLLEALRVIATDNFKPKNTLEFHFYSGREGGLLGSRDIMQDYKTRDVNILALLNQDMAGYSSNSTLGVSTDYVSTLISDYVTNLIPIYTGIGVRRIECGYACGDHFSAYDAGFPAAYVTDEVEKGSINNVRTSHDTYERVDFKHVHQHISLTIGFLVEASFI